MTFPFHASLLQSGKPVSFGADLPEKVDLAIIGGGVLGVCTALFAARAGLSVLLLEKGRVAAEQSSRNWGWVRVQGRDVAEIPIALESQTHWQALDAELQGRLGLRQIGVTYLARSDKDMAGYEDWIARAQPHGVSSTTMGRAAVQELLGQPEGNWVGGLHTPTDLKAEPWVAVPELARLAQEAGALIREGCAVRALDFEAGRVTGVVTEAGRVQAGKVVLAGGSWSSLFLRRHGVTIPQLSVRSTVVATQPLPQVLATAAVDDRLAMRPRADGGYTLAPAAFGELFAGPDLMRHIHRYLPLALTGEFDVHLRPPAPKHYPDAFGTKRNWAEDARSPFEDLRILDPKPNARKVAEITRRFAEIYPQVGAVEPHAAWAGMIDVLPDVVPVVDHVKQLPGLIVATGMCGHGFGIGPAFGRILADMAQGKPVGHDLSRFSMGRFSDGSRLRPGPNL
ncbi:NAD(P)/FAD-dependent oxidoreductase [Gymnodinialimonas ceratoperidinii]|uniref:FAD-binding oxidoreductase n=1 Tax=Gymnodinialimonas ceratoperidinii TaxID=2856823 RepID=A0A8F6TY25_9RHOB|nr:FAD-binding oxidoreductase [Gymnodinialimonas ceratoperidinii]QXT40815.1 FAD-binding oxidoreductase [Gymnodinialimonas ceratoperidinii]